ncbi:vitellogenin receptor-like [Mytilus californianus]|uniref:vitellogenin receptor-like n=1 Tax=Mytilus californianus TaxID=6549 RepID=UPI0022465673|nr:vitellogenin receptor-like [Mytilus californianus]
MEVKVLLCMCLLLHCTLHKSSFHGQLLFSNSTSIMELDVDTLKMAVLVAYETSYVYDMAYHNKYLYFQLRRSDYNAITRFQYPSKNQALQTVVQTGVNTKGLAIDSANNHLYWSDNDNYTVSRCNLDGTHVTVLTTLTHPFVIRLDVTNRWMYIVESVSGILKSRFDLANQQTIVNFTSKPVYCMDIDTDEQRLYWIGRNGDIKSTKDDGSDVKTILSTNNIGEHYAIAVFGSYIYYSYLTQLLMVSKTPLSMPTVLYTDTSWIDCIFVFNQSSK